MQTLYIPGCLLSTIPYLIWVLILDGEEADDYDCGSINEEADGAPSDSRRHFRPQQPRETVGGSLGQVRAKRGGRTHLTLIYAN